MFIIVGGASHLVPLVPDNQLVPAKTVVLCLISVNHSLWLDFEFLVMLGLVVALQYQVHLYMR